MPPQGAKLVVGMYGYINGPVYSPAFLLNQKPDGSVDLLFGSEQKTLHPKDVTDGPLWEEMPADSSLWQARWIYARQTTFVCAAQLADRWVAPKCGSAKSRRPLSSTPVSRSLRTHGTVRPVGRGRRCREADGFPGLGSGRLAAPL